MKHSNIAIFIPHVGCKNQCSFCNQRIISGNSHAPTVQEVYDVLCKANSEIQDKSNTQVAFFGGSFTAIDREYMISLLEVANQFDFNGIRISTRPDCIDSEILKILKKYNVKAIELGAQSMDDDVLKCNNRRHSSEDIITASVLIKQYGFSLGLQMMVGLYGDSCEKSLATCDGIIKLKPDTVRIYPTVILKGTELEAIFNSGEYNVMPLGDAVDVCSEMLWRFEKNDINVIKLGLHASKDVEEQMVGGIYHPAFRELCEGKLYGRLASELLEKSDIKAVKLYVNPKAMSKLIGQNKVNAHRFMEQGYNVKFLPDKNLLDYQLRIEKDGMLCY